MMFSFFGPAKVAELVDALDLGSSRETCESSSLSFRTNQVLLYRGEFMQVSVETKEGLERQIRVEIPSDDFQKALDAKLQSASKTVRMDGFRKGKVPMDVVKQKYGADLQQEVASDMVKSTLFEAIDQVSLKPASMPNVAIETVEDGKDFTYSATFEVIPEVEVKSLDGLEIEQITADIKEEDIDKMVEQLREQHKDWVEADRASKAGDQVNLDFDGSIDGEPLEGGKADGFDLELGSGNMIPGFEDGIMGMKAGEEKEISLKFPEEYHHQEIAGKDVIFKIKVHTVKEGQLPELNEEFFKKFNVESGGVDALRDMVKNNLSRQLNGKIKSENKQAVLQKLAEINEVDIPKAFIKDEIERMKQRMFQGQPGMNEQMGDMGEQFDELFREQAEKSVKSALLMSEVMQQNDIKADDDSVKALVEDMSKDYDDSEEFVKYYYSDEKRLEEIRNIATEDKIYEYLLGQCKVKSVSKSYDDIMNPQTEEEK